MEERKSTKYKFNTTIVTWIRNEIGHTREESSINEIKDLVHEYIYN